MRPLTPLIMIIFLTLASAAALANGGPIDGSRYHRTGTIVPLQQSGVRLREEQLTVSLAGDEARVEVRYQLVNSAQAAEVEFAFPVDRTDEDWSRGRLSGIRYAISDGSAKIAYTARTAPEPVTISLGEQGSFPCRRLWHVSHLSFKPREKKQLVITYTVPCSFTDLATSKSIIPYFGTRLFRYGFSFAAGWGDGTVGKLSIAVDTSGLSADEAVVQRVLPGTLVKKGTRYEATFENVKLSSMKDLVVEYDSSAKKLRQFFAKSAIDQSKIRITASSQLAGNYSPRNILDGKKETVWAEGVPGTGEGQWMDIAVKGTTISYIGLINGVVLTEQLYKGNARIAKIKVDCFGIVDGKETQLMGDGTIVDLPDRPFRDALTPQTVLDTGMPVLITRVRLTILSTHRGTAYEDCAVTDLILLHP